MEHQTGIVQTWARSNPAFNPVSAAYCLCALGLLAVGCQRTETLRKSELG